jgi:glycosyltransferase involved in cell wall biosynthesis
MSGSCRAIGVTRPMPADPSPGRRPRVALLTPIYPPLYSGAAEQAVTLIRALLGRGATVTVLTSFPGRPPTGEHPKGARVLRFPTPRAPMARELVLGACAAAWLLGSSRWDVLHLIDFPYAAVLPSLVARMRGRPILTKTTLLEPHQDTSSPGARLLRAVRGWGLRRSDGVVALSEAIALQLRADCGDLVRILRIPNGVDTTLFRPGTAAERSATRRALGLEEDELVVSTCGALIRRKNIVAILRAAGAIRRRPVRIVLAGPPGKEPAYEREIEDAIAGLPDRMQVARTGHIDLEAVARLLSVSDVFVLASRAEGMPNALLEAMAAGVACIATDIPGSRDVLAGGGGRLVPLDDLAALRAALDELADSPDLRAKLGAEARDLVERDFSLASVADRYLDAYARLGGPAGTRDDEQRIDRQERR